MLTRRSFLAGATGAVILGACGESTSSPVTTTAASGTGGRVLGAGFSDGFRSPPVLISGIEQRLPLVIFEAEGAPARDNIPDTFEVAILRAGAIVATQTVRRHATGIPTPYYPLTFSATEPGDYEARAAFSTRPMPFRVATRDTVKLAQIGDPLRAVLTPTTTDARGVDPVCTRSPKPCPFHAVTVTQAIAAAKPTVLVISTPGFCQTAICGPVLEMLVERAPNLARFQIVHAEVFKTPNAKTTGSPATTDAIKTYNLDYEPTLFVADAGAIVRARLDFTWDATELDAALERVR